MYNRKYILHATNGTETADSIKRKGLKYKEGRATVTGNLKSCLNLINDRNWENPHILVLKSPDDKILWHQNKSFIDVNDNNKKVTGEPEMWQAGRKNTAIYESRSSMKRTPTQVVENSEKNKNRLSKDLTIMDIVPSQELFMLMDKLSSQIKLLEVIDWGKYLLELENILKKESGWINLEVTSIATSILNSTIEDIIIRNMRNLFLLFQKYKWYDIVEKDWTQSNYIWWLETFPEIIEYYKTKVSDSDFNIVNNKVFTRYVKSAVLALYMQYKDSLKVPN